MRRRLAGAARLRDARRPRGMGSTVRRRRGAPHRPDVEQRAAWLVQGHGVHGPWNPHVSSKRLFYKGLSLGDTAEAEAVIVLLPTIVLPFNVLITGRINNEPSKDMVRLDTKLPSNASNAAKNLLACMGTRSPYPSVVHVTTEKYKKSPLDKSFLSTFSPKSRYIKANENIKKYATVIGVRTMPIIFHVDK